MKNTNNTKKMSKLVEKALNFYPMPDSYGWPPECLGYYYQPERPVVKTDTLHDEKNKKPAR